MASEYGDELDQFLLVVEQLQVCRDLLQDDAPTKARMALILLDNLADTLIYRRCQERHGDARRRIYWAAQLTHARRDLRGFHNRLRFVQQEVAIDLRQKPGEPPFVDGPTAAVLEVAHRYRNAAYHEDEHNPAVVAVLAKILFATVATMWVRECSARVILGISGSHLEPRLARLARYRLPRATDDVFRTKGIYWADASAHIAARLSDGMRVPLALACGLMADDIARRLHDLEAAITHDLPASHQRELNGHIARHEFLDHIDTDPELRRHREARFQPLRERLRSGEFAAETTAEAEAVEAAERDYARRWQELWATFEPKATTAVLDAGKAAIPALVKADSEALLLTRYAAIDEPLSRFESYVGLVREEWDMTVQAQIDYERGK